MKKLISFLLAIAMVMSLFVAGCGEKKAADNKAASKKVSAEKKEIEITDSLGNKVKLPSAPKKIVVTNKNVAEAICVLGGEDKIVGVSNETKFPESLKKKEKAGKSFTPNIEKILELKPDLVIGYGSFLKNGTVDKLKEAGIPFASIDCYKIEKLDNDIRVIGKLLGEEKKTEEYLGFINKYLKYVNDKVEKIDKDKRVKVYWEGYTDFSTVSKGTGGDEVVSAAGGINIAGEETVEYPKVNNEFIIKKNPDIVVKTAKTAISQGYGVTDKTKIKEFRDTLMTRTGWKDIKAVKNNRVYVISNEIATSVRGVVGVCYLAKWFYPDEFKDLDPEAVHKEMFEKFYNMEYKGTWVCP